MSYYIPCEIRVQKVNTVHCLQKTFTWVSKSNKLSTFDGLSFVAFIKGICIMITCKSEMFLFNLETQYVKNMNEVIQTPRRHFDQLTIYCELCEQGRILVMSFSSKSFVDFSTIETLIAYPLVILNVEMIHEHIWKDWWKYLV